MLTGSFVSTFYGDPRTTRDLDLVIKADEPPGEAVQRFVELCLLDGFYVSEESALGPLSTGRRQFNVISSTTGWKADIMWLTDRPFSRSEFDRRTTLSLLGIEVLVPTPEDLVLAKLEWGGSAESRQFEDAVSVVRITGTNFDFTYARKWASDLGITDLFERAVAAAS